LFDSLSKHENVSENQRNFILKERTEKRRRDNEIQKNRFRDCFGTIAILQQQPFGTAHNSQAG
jgi:hypothetical protein